jgi:hypothetical protein
MRPSRGSRKSVMRRSANSWSQSGKNQGAVRSTCLTLKSSGYFWLSLMKQTRSSTAAFSTGDSPNTSIVPAFANSCPVSSDMSVVLPAPLRPRSP